MQKYLSILLALLFSTLVTACGDNGTDPHNIGDPNDSTFTGLYFNIKSATVTYSTENYVGADNADIKIIFDDYGKKFRYETEETVCIVDEDANKFYMLTPETKTYIEYAYNMGISQRVAFMYLGDDASSVWSYYPGFKKESNRTIAGKSCSVCSWGAGSESWEWGGWQRITFISKETYTGEISKFEAKSITESANADDFKVPSDYTKLSF